MQKTNEFIMHTDPNHFYDEFVKVKDEIINQYGEKINCFTFYEQLKERYPGAIAFYDGDHILTMLNGSLYDKSGCRMYNFKELEPDRYQQAVDGEWLK